MANSTCLANHFQPDTVRPARSFATWTQVQQPAFCVSALLWVVSAAGTVLWCNSMSSMPGMPMPGGWTMSMTWMRMPGQTWTGATGSFLAMWVLMMAAMMLPSLAPMLHRYCQWVEVTGEARRRKLTALAGVAYFSVWALAGLAVFPLGVALANFEMKIPAVARAVPIASGLAVLIAGALQFTRWKMHQLTCCREAPGRDRTSAADAGAAWKLGVHYGLHCCLACANLTVVLVAIGMMDLRAMAAVTAAITAERLAPAGERVARGIGAAAIAAGLVLVVRAVTLQ